MSASSRMASRLSACLAWMPCLRRSSETGDGSDEEKIPVEPQGSILNCGPGKFHNGLRWQKRQLVLYSNVLLISTTKGRDPLVIKYTMRLLDLWVAYNREKQGRRARSSLILGWRDKRFVVSFGTVERMQRWYDSIYGCIARINTDYLVAKFKMEKERLKRKRPSLKMIWPTSEDTGQVEVVVSAPQEGSSEPPSDSQKRHEIEGGRGPATDHLSVKNGASATYSGLQPFYLLEQMIYDIPGLLSEDQRVVRRHHHKTIWLTAGERQSDISAAIPNVESIAQCCISTHLREKPTWSPVLDRNVFEIYTESLWGSGDRVSRKVLLYNYPRGHPTLPLNRQVGDIKEHICLAPQKKVSYTKFSSSMAMMSSSALLELEKVDM